MKTYTKTEIAINLLLSSGENYRTQNYISAIVLAGAAQQILRDLCKTKEIKSSIKSLACNQNKTGRELHKLITATYNRLKHADLGQRNVEICAEEFKVLHELAATDLLRLNSPPCEELKKIINFNKSLAIKG